MSIPQAFVDTCQHLPQTAGVYLFSGQAGQVIYVGKSVNLKRRVSSYFNRNHPQERLQMLVKNICYINYRECPGELSALLLEDELIKIHRPMYNRQRKKTGSYAYLTLDNSTYPALRTITNPEPDQLFWGPFNNRYQAADAAEVLARVTGLRTCANPRGCLKHNLGQCVGVCKGVNPGAYKRSVTKLHKIMAGDDTLFNSLLTKRIKKLSAQRLFEQASLLYQNGQQLTRQIKQLAFFERFLSSTMVFYEQPGLVLVFKQGVLLATLNRPSSIQIEHALNLPLPATLPRQLLLDRARLLLSWHNRKRCLYLFIA